ncbi:MAG: hypothetical protein ACK4UX_13430, partial [Thiobacillus sp.]
ADASARSSEQDMGSDSDSDRDGINASESQGKGSASSAHTFARLLPECQRCAAALEAAAHTVTQLRDVQRGAEALLQEGGCSAAAASWAALRRCLCQRASHALRLMVHCARS